MTHSPEHRTQELKGSEEALRVLDEVIPPHLRSTRHGDSFMGERYDILRAAFSACDAEVKRLREALEAIVSFCDDPNGSDQGESLAFGLSRLLPAARAALEQTTSTNKESDK